MPLRRYTTKRRRVSSRRRSSRFKGFRTRRTYRRRSFRRGIRKRRFRRSGRRSFRRVGFRSKAMKPKPTYTSSHGKKVKPDLPFQKRMSLASAAVTEFKKTYTYTETGSSGASHFWSPRVSSNSPPSIAEALLQFPQYSDFLNGGFTVGKTRVRIMVFNQRVKYTVVNSTNVPLNLRVYECVSRGVADGMDEVIGNRRDLILKPAGGQIQLGFDHLAYVGFLSNTLYDNPVFCRAHRIVNDKQYQLQPGVNTEFVVNDLSRHTFETEDLWATINTAGTIPNSSDILSYTKGSRFFVFQQSGGIVFSSVAGTQTSTGPSQLSVLEDSTISVSLTQFNGTGIQYYHNVPVIATAKVEDETNQNFENVEVG
uniref:Uncharacterized protein n=1 Tax=Antarctic circular DNA molecule TaxID=2664238 RepID=A0A5Q2F612_9ZZZZ|nr:hypothetical protein [Antarctic circular DNA molecule]